MKVLILITEADGFKMAQRIDDVTSVQDAIELFMLMKFTAVARDCARDLWGYFTEPKGGYFGNP